jgi:uncharacterized delta-60 repeat protein
VIRVLPALVALLLAVPVHAMVIDPVDPAQGVALIEIPPNAAGDVARLLDIAALADGGVVAATTLPRDDLPGCHALTLHWVTGSGAPAASKVAVPCTSGTVALAASGDGALYLQGRDGPGDGDGPQRVWKLRADGTVDASFDGNIPMVRSFFRPTIEVLPGGTVAVGGTATLSRSGTPYNALVVVHLRPDGTADPSYGTQGVAIAQPPNRPMYGREGGGMAHNADGSVLVAGNIFEDDAGAKIYTDATVARFDAQGRLDLAYGRGGFAIPVPDASTYVQRLSVRKGEAFVSVIQNRDAIFAFVAKLRADGTLDPSYGVGGTAQIDDYVDSNFHPLIAVDADGRAYVHYLDTRLTSRIARFDPGGAPDAAFGLDGSAVVAADGATLTGGGDLAIEGHRAYLATGTFAAGDGSPRTGIGVARLAANGGHRDDVTGGQAVVYYNAALDHYFLTANPAEQALLDDGTTRGWQRTGSSFGVVVSAAGDPDLTPVCRFYGRPEAHLDSHFFSAAPDECAAVAATFGASWLLEADAVFRVHPADRTTGRCPRGSEPVYRAFNNRADANHYYGTLPGAPAGWTYEGYGPGARPTAFCAPRF